MKKQRRRAWGLPPANKPNYLSPAERKKLYYNEYVVSKTGYLWTAKKDAKGVTYYDITPVAAGGNTTIYKKPKPVNKTRSRRPTPDLNKTTGYTVIKNDTLKNKKPGLKKAGAVVAATEKGNVTQIPYVASPAGKAKTEPAKTTRKKTKKLSSGSMTLHPGNLITRTLTIGKPMIPILRTVSKMNGTYSKIQTDTAKDSSFLTRDDQHLDFGFNQKLVVIMPVGTSNALTNIRNITSSGYTLDTTEQGTLKMYASLMRIWRKWVIHNNGTFHKIKLGIHIIGARTPRASHTDLKNIFNTSDIETQEAGRMPVLSQFSLPVTTGANQGIMTKVLVHPNANPFKADNFKANFVHLKSLYQTLEPNDTFNFNFERLHKGGIDIYDLQNRISDTGSVPAGEISYDHYVVMTLHGTECEAIYRESSTETTPRLGKSPGWAFFEYSEGYTQIIRASTPAGQSPSSTEPECHIRTFYKNDIVAAPLFNKDSTLVTNDYTIPTIGDYFIPVVSDQLQTSEYPKAQRKPD